MPATASFTLAALMATNFPFMAQCPLEIGHSFEPIRSASLLNVYSYPKFFFAGFKILRMGHSDRPTGHRSSPPTLQAFDVGRTTFCN